MTPHTRPETTPTPDVVVPTSGLTPAEAWEVLAEGNRRFVAGEPSHPNQNAERRSGLTAGQAPVAVIFGCADSRLAAEIIFDLGLGDVFVVRTAGHVIDDAVLGSIEYGVDVLEIPLVIVLGHNSCGAVTATVESYISGTMPRGFVRPVVEADPHPFRCAGPDGEAGAICVRHRTETAVRDQGGGRAAHGGGPIR